MKRDLPVEISLRSGDLHDAFARTQHAIYKETNRSYPSGVYIHSAPDGATLNFIAADGHRLAQVRVPINPTVGIEPVVVGAAFVAEALKLLSRKSHHPLPAKLTLSTTLVRITDWRGETAEAEPVDCTYPDYARTIPHDPPVRVAVLKDELVMALEPIAGFLRPTGQHAVKLTASGEMLTLGASIRQSYPSGVTASAESAVRLAEPASEPYEIGFNAEYLLEALKTFGRRGSPAMLSICAHDLGRRTCSGATVTRRTCLCQ